MEPEGSLPHSQVPATCPFPSQPDPVHTPTYNFMKIHLNIILPSTPGCPKWFLSPHVSPSKPCIDIILQSFIKVAYLTKTHSCTKFMTRSIVLMLSVSDLFYYDFAIAEGMYRLMWWLRMINGEGFVRNRSNLLQCAKPSFVRTNTETSNKKLTSGPIIEPRVHHSVLALFRLINSHGRHVGIVKMHHDGAISNCIFFIPNLKKVTCPVMTFK